MFAEGEITFSVVEREPFWLECHNTSTIDQGLRLCFLSNTEDSESSTIILNRLTVVIAEENNAYKTVRVPAMVRHCIL